MTRHRAGSALLFAAAAATTAATVPVSLQAQRLLYRTPDFEVTDRSVRQGRFEAEALGREELRSSYPRAAREVHFKFAIGGSDNEFPPGIEHVVNLRPRSGRVATPTYVFGVPPQPVLPRPEDAGEGEDGLAAMTIRLDLRAVLSELQRTGRYRTPQGGVLDADRAAAARRPTPLDAPALPVESPEQAARRVVQPVYVIGDTEPLRWDVRQLAPGSPQELTDPDGDGIYETTLTFRSEYLRPLAADGRAIWRWSRALHGFPTLHSPEPLLDAVHHLAHDELAELVRPDSALAAGAKWPGVWTRDVALASVLGLAFAAPDAVRASLMKKVDGRGRIIQDTGTGGSWPVSTDRMTWALAAWELYAVTGDRTWLRQAYDVIARSAAADLHAAHDTTTGLFRGESSFLDWREQSYARWMQPADIYQSQALGTNAVHHGAYRVLARMARELGEPARAAEGWEAIADGVRRGIERELWDPSRGRHAPFRAGWAFQTGASRFEALGEALAILTGATDRERRATVIRNAPLMPFGTPTIHPFIPDIPYYHNGSIWPFVTAYWTWAAAEAGDGMAVEHGLASMTRGSALFLTNKENLVAATGHFEGTALNSDRQLWSVAGSLAMQYRVLFGLRAEHDRLRFAPMVPPAYAGTRVLSGLRYRGATLTVHVIGTGNGVARAKLDGAPLARAEVPASLTGLHVIELEMNGRWSSGAPEGGALTAPQRFADAVVSPDTPVPESMPGGFRWKAVPGATRYVIHRNGVALDTVTATRMPVQAGASLTEYQVTAIDADGRASFPSRPWRVQRDRSTIERRLGPVGQEGGVGSVVEVPSRGRYALSIDYQNPNGPINTEDKAAIRTLRVDGRPVGVVVMPQRGAGNLEVGSSNPVIVFLEGGRHAVELVQTPLDANMNGEVNDATMVLLRAVRLPPPVPPAPRIDKVEPPDWWVGHSIDPVRLLIRGAHLMGATFQCGALRCGTPRFSRSGTYAFVDVAIAAGTRPGRYPIRARTAGGVAAFDFTVHAPLARAGRFQGVGADDVLYLIMPDRFANGDRSNDDPVHSRGLHDRSDPRYYHGGDIEGVRQKLPYLKSLGVTAVWLTPIYDNVDSIAHRAPVTWAPRGYTDYHGYGATDLYAVEEHLGDLASYRRLVDEAHALGMKVVIDMVANHTGPEHVWAQDPPTPTWYAGTLSAHLPNNWQVWSLADPYAARAVRDSTLRGWFADILPDFDQGDPEVERYLIQNTLWWTGQTGIDAIRQDTWPYAPRSFWKPWMAAIKREHPSLTVVGEVLQEDPALVAFFEGTKANFDGVRTGLDQLFDFPLQAAVRRAFLRGGQLREVAQLLARDRLYDHPERLVTVSDNHDMDRLSRDSTVSIDGLLLAYTLQLTVRGIPQLYYGNEIALHGGGDPDNRRDFPGGWPEDARNAFDPAGRDATQARVWEHIRALLALRRERADLRRTRMERLLVEEQRFVYRRGGTTVAINNGTAPASVRVPWRGPARAAAVGGCAAPEVVDGVARVELPARTGCVF